MVQTSWFRHALSVLMLVGGALALSYTDPKGMRALMTLYGENRRVGQEIKQLKQKQDEINRHIEAFRTHPAHQERIVRSQTGYLRPNEMLIEWL